jgi:hypothetical protein
MIDAFLFTGIAGLKKRNCLAHLRNYILSTYAPDTGSDPQDLVIPIVELARLTRQEVEGDFFDLYPTYEDRLLKFRNRISDFGSISHKNIRCIFIHTHLTHFMTGHFRSWVGSADYSDLFQGLQIKKVIHLIDNIYTCQHNIAKDGYPYTLDQVILWRDTEQMVTDILSGLLFKQTQLEKSKVLAINHCLETAADILFNDQKRQLYMAYPISKLRDIERFRQAFGDVATACLDDESIRHKVPKQRKYDHYLKLRDSMIAEFPDKSLTEVIEDLQQQNAEYRHFFTREFIAYDPSTIDEWPLLDKVVPSADTQLITLTPNDCWPLVCEPEMRIAGRDVTANVGRLEIPADQVKELKVPTAGDQQRFWTSIHRQTRSRDFRLIEQADGLVA